MFALFQLVTRHGRVHDNEHIHICDCVRGNRAYAKKLNFRIAGYVVLENLDNIGRSSSQLELFLFAVVLKLYCEKRQILVT